MTPLVEGLQNNGYLRDELLIQAFESVGRADFLPPEFESEADADIPLPIGHGQMGPQPSTVAVMLELLEARVGQKILSLGGGSGWTTGLLAYVVGDDGRVVAFEGRQELFDLSQRNLEKFDFVKSGRVECLLGEGIDGHEKEAPFDRILVSASAEAVPPALKAQLKIGGKMVIPIRNHLCYFEKRSEEELYKEEFPGFVFVPLIMKSF